jgi:hypothetical protein
MALTTLPKPAAIRQRKNRHTTAATLEAGPAVKPDLPYRDTAHPMTVLWWETIWASPMTSEWVDADVPDLLALGMLVDMFWHKPDPKLHSEIRMAGREFGLTPMSRRSLQWEVKRVEQAKAAVASTRARDPRLRSVG